MTIHIRATSDSDFVNCGDMIIHDKNVGDLNVADCRPCWAVQLRSVRENLGLSRADVTKATGLSDSIVWRAEQPHRKVTREQFTQIWDYLMGVDSDAIAKPKKQKKQKSTSSDDAHSHKLTEVRTAVLEALETAKQKKRSTSELKTILELIDA